MLRDPNSLSTTRRPAAVQFWRRVSSRFHRQVSRLSRYPWPMQFSPRFAFALPRRWRVERGAQGDERCVCSKERSHSPIRRRTGVAKARRFSARPSVGHSRPERVAVSRGALSVSAVPRIVVARTFVSTVATHTFIATAAAHAAPAPANFNEGARWVTSERVVVQAASVGRLARGAIRGVSVSRGRQRLIRMVREGSPPVTRSRQPLPTVRHARAGSGRTVRPLASSVAVLANRASVPVRGSDVSRPRSSARAGHYRHRRRQPSSSRGADVFGAAKPVSSHAMSRSFGIGAPRASRRSFPEWGPAFDRRPGNVLAASSPTAGPHRVLRIAYPAAARPPVVASGSQIVPRRMSERGHAPVPARSRPGGDRSRIAILAAYGFAAQPVQQTLRRRARQEWPAAQAGAAAGQVRSIREPRSASVSDRGEPIRATTQTVADVAEMRRIILPLLQETIFSELTMGRLANGVLTQLDRRESTERYRKSGGR